MSRCLWMIFRKQSVILNTVILTSLLALTYLAVPRLGNINIFTLSIWMNIFFFFWKFIRYRSFNLYSKIDTHICWACSDWKQACWWAPHFFCSAVDLTDCYYMGHWRWTLVFAESWLTSAVECQTIGFWPIGTVTWSALSPFLMVSIDGGNCW